MCGYLCLCLWAMSICAESVWGGQSKYFCIHGSPESSAG